MDKWLGTSETPPQSNVIPLTRRNPTEGVHPYAAAIAAAWCDRLAQLKKKPWQQGDAWDTNCYTAARKFNEVANSAWSGYSHDQARNDYFTHAPHDSVWDKREKCWQRGSADAGTLPEPVKDEAYSILPVTILDVRGADAFWTERETLRHIHTFARARRVAPWAVLGYVLARVVTATSPAIALPPLIGGYASLNLFVAIVGASGAGKGAAGATARDAIDVGDITTLNPGSGEGLIHAYVRRVKGELDHHTTAVLFNVPEIDTLAAVGARQGSTVMPILRSGWSGEQIGTQTADISRRVHVPEHKYRMCMVAGVQPGRASALLDDEDGGTPQRFLWLPATDPTIPDAAPSAPAQLTINTKARIEADGFVNGDGIQAMTVCDKATRTIEQAHLDRARGKGDAIDGHALLTRLKVAAALALLDERRDITEDDWRLSRVITRVSDATRAGVVAHRQAAAAQANEARAKGDAHRQIIVSETLAAEAAKRVARGIMRHLSSGELKWNEAAKKFSSEDRRKYFQAAIDSLLQAGQIAVDEDERGRVIRAL